MRTKARLELSVTGNPESPPVAGADVRASGPVQPAVPTVPADEFHDVAAEMIAEIKDDEVDALRARVERLEADQRLRDELAAQCFRGSRYDRFEVELVRYALAVFNAWLLSGAVFTHLGRLHIRLKVSDAVTAQLRQDRDLRTEISGLVVAGALPRFKQQALVEGGWTSTKQASLTTYFMGATLWVFPNEFRRLQGDLFRNRLARPADYDELFENVPARTIGVESLALTTLQLDDYLRPYPAQTRQVVLLTIMGYSQIEIAELLGLPSDRAVEGVLYRWRTSEKDRLGRGKEVSSDGIERSPHRGVVPRRSGRTSAATSNLTVKGSGRARPSGRAGARPA